MTGLDLEADALIEVAALVTDFELQVLGDGIDLVIKPPPEALDQMGDFVRDMHRSSGLLDQLDHGITLAEAEEQVLAYVKAHCPRPAGRRSPATRSPPTARSWPATCPRWSVPPLPHRRRLLDQGTLRRWFPRAYFQSPAKRGNHRALADIQESIEELRYYREAIFIHAARPRLRHRPGDRGQARRVPHRARRPGGRGHGARCGLTRGRGLHLPRSPASAGVSPWWV